jgi:diguanylate cyclase (GGDEF)-like protein
MYVGGYANGVSATRRLWIFAIVFAAVSAVASRNGLNEMVIWQSVLAVPALGYGASALLWLPRARRTQGSIATGVAFAMLAALWLVYGAAFPIAIGAADGLFATFARFVVSFNSYLDLSLDVLLGYAMVLLLMEDNKREMDDAQAELLVTHDQLRRAALYDSLTDSLNRRAFAEGVGLDMVKATFGTAVLADLDNLKFVNDRFGHAAGDQMLRRCADVLRATLRRYDKLYRWGGDEFLLIVPSAHAADVTARLRAAIDESEPVTTPAGERFSLAVSLGAADYTSSEELAFAIERADRAMYAEKSRRKMEMRGETGEVVYSPPTSLPAVR